MKSRNWLKGLGVTMIATTLILTGCGNGDAEKTDTEEQTKSVEEEGKEVKIESNEGKLQHEQLIKIELPPKADYLNDETLEVYNQAKKKYDQTNQLITNDSITVLVGDYGYYDSVWGSLDCSAVIINGTKSSIKDLSFEVSVEDNVLPEKVFLNSEALSLTKTQIGDFEPNTGVPIVITFPEKNATGEDEDKKIDTKNVKIQIKNIQFTAID
ncbi:TPA: hypothetical protein PNM72_001389 [Listeria monocytogenes]|nr:hypothetical protein [Listeria monocytogenes]ADB69692.1 hypothetical protein LM5578_2946 [Listeria monocytogenes 08-5578]ADB72736.1 hypothetical protein LM5923_2895 [Listeria monocytogenes 08-5923]AHF33607.1 hypothetical protein A430_2989 [Listeria monocytogenes serotype 1/2a str. 08-6569]AHF36598.1 hypothetical protein A431_2989 [Listeria monocytogenes serotype 1/2a str. 08-6997]AHF39589.1 hypothetical protein A435_2989 [Listeria monocytogenes serotype 1/2a str. 10-0815]